MRFEVTYHMDAPPEEVFAVLADISRRPEWVGIASTRSQIGDEPVGPGTKYRAVDAIPGRRLEYTQTIDRLEPNEMFEESWDGPMGGRSTIRFDGDASTTKLEVEADVASPLPSWLAFLEPVFRVWAKRAFTKDLDRLNALVTGRSP